MKTTTPTHLNGIDTAALAAIIGGVQGDAAQGQVGFRVRTAWQGGTRSDSRTTDWRLAGKTLPRQVAVTADEPRELLGGGAAPNPQELLLSALNACMTVGYVALSTLQGIRLDSLEIETDCNLDLRGFLGLDEAIPAGCPEIRYTVRIRGDGTEAQFREIHQMVQATSPNYWNLTRPVRLVATLEVA